MARNALKTCAHILIIAFLTIVTQIGGLVWLINICFYHFIDKKISSPIVNRTTKLISFLLLYFFISFTILPSIARKCNRVPLPVTQQRYLQPLNIMTCMLNRHWVTPELRDQIFAIASEMNSRYPGTVTNYLEANFPLFNGFPLWPHLSHNDGKKLDISFFYIDVSTGKFTSTAPSISGYGISEEPLPGETDISGNCRKQGYWQYSLMRNLMPQNRKSSFRFDSKRTKSFLELCASREKVSRIFIEPHLKKRLGLSSDKIRFHGCQAVRHDDHIHIQVK